MRRLKIERRRESGWLGLVLAALLTMQPALLSFAADRADAADTAATAATSAALSESFLRVLDGGVPQGLTDLRAMQNRVTGLADQVRKCTVGVLVGQAWGSGVIVSKDGYVLTAAHVAGAGRNRGRGEAEFVLSDGRKLKGKTLGLFRTVDAGLMKITEAGEYPFAEMGSSDALKFGQWCLAVGHPGGHQEERGTVLRLGRIEGMDDESITTDCTLVGGDSGGPLFDLHGRVIGINSRIGEQLYNNMHVPVSAYQKSWDRLVKAETWGHLPGQDPYLGVTGEEKREGEGARIATVKKDSPGEKYGLRPGDVVVRFDEKEISSFQSLVAAVADCEPNESVKLRVRRGEETVELRLRLGKKP